MMREILNHIQALVASSEDRFTKARELARIIRDRGQYRWVGAYDVGLERVAIISWSGPGAPAYPTFSINRGLTASVIREKPCHRRRRAERSPVSHGLRQYAL
jgi:hypothetical protein